RAVERPEDVEIPFVTEPPGGLVAGQPFDLVDLVPRGPFAVLGAHRPVPDGLGSQFQIGVDRAGELGSEVAAQTRLLLDFPDRSLLVALALLDLSLRKRPVAIARPGDEEDLEPAVSTPPPR